MTTTLRDCADRWMEIKSTGKPSPDTVGARKSDLANIARCLTGAPAPTKEDRLSLDDLAPLTVDDVDRYSMESAFAAFAAPRSASTIRRAHSTWNGFMNWMVREELISANPMIHIELPKKPGRQKRSIPKPSLVRLAEQVKEPTHPGRQPWPERDLALFAILVLGGLRISEAKDLQLGNAHIDDDPPSLVVNGKGGKQRTVPIPAEAVDAIKAYLESRKAKNFPMEPRSALLLRPNGNPMTRGAIDYRVSEWFRRAGRTPPKGAVTHALRHTYAHLLVSKGTTAIELQGLLGHESLGATQEYLKGSESALAAASNSNPARHLFATNEDSQ